MDSNEKVDGNSQLEGVGDRRAERVVREARRIMAEERRPGEIRDEDLVALYRRYDWTVTDLPNRADTHVIPFEVALAAAKERYRGNYSVRNVAYGYGGFTHKGKRYFAQPTPVTQFKASLGLSLVILLIVAVVWLAHTTL